MTDYEQLYKLKVNELSALENEFKEFKETSKFFEEELENQVNVLQQQNLMLENQLEKISQEFKNFKTDIEITISNQEKLIKNHKNETDQHRNQIKTLQKSLIDMENEYENCQNQLRQSQDVIINQEQKSEQLMEQLSLAQLENEDNQNKYQEQIERLREQIKEYESELKVIHLKNQKYLEESDSRLELHMNQKLQNQQLLQLHQLQITPFLKQLSCEEEEKAYYDEEEENDNEDTFTTIKKQFSSPQKINKQSHEFNTPTTSPIKNQQKGNTLFNQSQETYDQYKNLRAEISNKNKLSSSLLILNNIIKNLDNNLQRIQSPRRSPIKIDQQLNSKKNNIVNC